MKSTRPSLIYAVCTRFDGLKAIGVSRHHDKIQLRTEATARGITLPPVALSTGRIHADKTLDTYKGVALRYAHWARATDGVRSLAELDARAEVLVTLYLIARIEAGDSPSSLKTARAALRMFYRPAYSEDEREAAVRQLGAGVALPVRRRADITRSRGPAAMDKDIALERYTQITTFCRATGVRRRELEALTVGDVQEDDTGGLVVRVQNGKGGKHRTVPVLPMSADALRTLIACRPPAERLFPRVPVRLDVQSYRRLYAQDLYREGNTRLLPTAEGRLAPGRLDQERARVVARALGHGRTDVVVRHYLR